MPKSFIEEAAEFSRDFEIALNLPRKKLLDKTMEFIDEEVDETRKAIKAENRQEIIDGFGDVAFLAVNGIYKEFRTSGDEHLIACSKTMKVLERICHHNNAKRHSNGQVKYINNKVVKPDGWVPPAYYDLTGETPPEPVAKVIKPKKSKKAA